MHMHMNVCMQSSFSKNSTFFILIYECAGVQLTSTIYTGQKIEFPICPVYMQSDVSSTVFHQSCKCNTYPTFGSILYSVCGEQQMKWTDSKFSPCVYAWLLATLTM